MINIEKFWNNTHAWLLHATNKHKTPTIKNWENGWLSQIDLTNKVITDIGCGGGWLPEMLYLNKYQIEKYIGSDIVKKALELTKDVLDNTEFEYELNLGDGYIDNLFITPPDVITCFNVIHHLPHKIIADEFLTKLNDSNAKEIVLNYRSGPVTFNIDSNYTLDNITQENIIKANLLNMDYILSLLTKYKLKWASDTVGIIYAIFKIKPEYIEHPDLIEPIHLDIIEPIIDFPDEPIHLDIIEPIDEDIPKHVSEDKEAIEEMHEAGETRTGKKLYWYYTGKRVTKITQESAEKKGYRPATKAEII